MLNIMSTLIDWLYAGNQGALVLFPRMLDRWNVASLIVSQWEGYNVVIVTDNPNEFMNSVTSSRETKWTDLELIPFPLIEYSNFAEINRALKNTEVDIILFDDLRMLATISPALDLPSVETRVRSQIEPKIK